MQEADSQTQLRFGIAGSNLQRLAEVRSGLVPPAQLLETYCQLEVRTAMMWLQFHQVRICLHAFLIALQLIEDMAHGREDRGLVLTALYGPPQLAQRLFGLAFQV